MNLIYVRDKETKDKLIALGFELIKEDKTNGIWCFANKDGKAEFALAKDCAATNRLYL